MKALEDIELACLSTSPPNAPITPQLGSQPSTHPFGAATNATAADARQAASPPLLSQYGSCHSFDVAACAVSVLKFAPGSAECLAWGAADGVVYIATAEQPPRLLRVLDRHRGKVADLAWSADGATLLTCSLDGTAWLWQTGSGRLIRGMRNQSGALTCCAFHPNNENLLLLGTAAGEVLALNADTGRLVAKTELQAAPMVGVGASCLAFASQGQLLVADSRSCLHLINASLDNSGSAGGGAVPCLATLARFPPPGNRFHEPACLEYVAHSGAAGGPAVLLALSSGEVVLSRLHQKPYRLEAIQELRTAQASAKIKASLCPCNAAGQAELLATGGEDWRVHLVGLQQTREVPWQLATLAGYHQAPVLSVAWSFCGSMLASSDKDGVVVVWRCKPAQPTTR